MWLAVASSDQNRAHAVIEESWMSELDELGRKSANMVVDVTLETRTCPACFHEYAAGPMKCPGCGLFIGA